MKKKIRYFHDTDIIENVEDLHYLDNLLQCRCSCKNIKDKDASHHKVHFNTVMHKEYEAELKDTQQQQGLLAPLH